MSALAAELPTTYVRYHNGLEALRRTLLPPPPEERNVHCAILWGPTDVGKTHRVRTLFPGLFSIRAGRGPFDSYQGQQTILFDEFRPDDWPITDMNMYCDKWPCTLNCRYYNKEAAWINVFICANSNPENWWPNDSYLLRDAFFRRILNIYEVKSKEEIFIL